MATEVSRRGKAAHSTRLSIVSHGAPRHHFPTYANLLAAIAREGIEDLDRIITDSLAIADPRAALMRACQGVVDFAIQRPAMFELIARHDLLGGAGGNLRATTGQWLVALTERLREARPDAELAHALALWAGVQGLGVMLGRRGAEAITPQKVEPNAVLAVLLAGALGDG
ncbi:TetR/AcrR family transcriptional regulator [Nocardia cyriacigeorgica]|uniref:TetR/AcrR family transcriptional regulator n=1 Tax=Nocardia cyriacigeorgica TaxID=135487 RepID=A0A5R8P2N3_9NOCA|nr:TetR/AcrR family transcriptional regulator [Nocardia cyriacigeorgica]TLF82547.1 TetR/AcrR family transcriptional regulator [Nocardia cyriacigeorgica]